MGDNYTKIENIGSDIYEWYKGILLKERLLYGEMSELLLESVKPLGGYSKDVVYDELALFIVVNRLFNDAESAKYLLLRGLPSQAQLVIRDIIECTMLFRLFLKNQTVAKDWIVELKQYQPGDVNAKLLEMKVDAREYAFYGLLSHMGHSNLLASLSNVQEKEVKEGMLRTFHFGSTRTPEAIRSVQEGFLMLFFLIHISLIEPFAEFYFHHSGKKDYEVWAEKVNGLFPKLEDFVAEIHGSNRGKEAQGDQRIYKLVEKKMRLEEFKIRLSGSSD